MKAESRPSAAEAALEMAGRPSQSLPQPADCGLIVAAQRAADALHSASRRAFDGTATTALLAEIVGIAIGDLARALGHGGWGQ